MKPRKVCDTTNNNPKLDTLLVHYEPYVAALPLGHPLGEKETVGIANLGPLPMIIASGAKSTYIRMQFAPYFAQAGYKIRVGQEINQLPAVLGLVSSGIGCALQPQSVSKLSTAGVIYRRLAQR